MNTEWNWPGARWWKFDFHTHTPASYDYGKGPDQAKFKSRTPAEWLLDYMRAGIDCIAITDHNTGVWIDKLKEALENPELQKHSDFRPLYLFPGVEISVNGGVHLLAILDPSKATSDVDTLLGAVEYEGKKGRSDDVTRKSFLEVCQKIEQAGGIAIPAHVDGVNGLFKLTGTTLAGALGCESVLAMEIVDPSSKKPQVYHDKKLHWTELLGSDSHHPCGNAAQRYPGSHFTWVKMEKPSLEGLRLALLDGPLSVLRSDQASEDPNRHGDMAVESIEVRSARFMGRSQTFKVEFNPWFNAIIGGRGTGKSTLVEFLRIALQREDELPAALANDFQKYRNVYQSRDDNGLLTDQADLTVYYRKDRTRFRIHWSPNQTAVPIEVQNENGDWQSDPGDVAQRFPVRIYSQKQIFEVAKDPQELLRIVDEAREVGRPSWKEDWNANETHYLSLRAKAREIKARLEDQQRLLGELEDIKRKLSVFEQASYADVLKEYQKRQHQQSAVQSWENAWTDASDRLCKVARELLPDHLDVSFFEAGVDEDLDILGKAENTLNELKSVKERLEELPNQVDDIARRWRQARDGSPWKQAVDGAIQKYKELIQRLKEEKVGDPSAYGELVQRRQALEGKLKDLESRCIDLQKIRQQADESLKRITELRRDLTRRRKDFLINILRGNTYVRIDVIPYGARDGVELELRQLLQRESGGFEKDIGVLVEELYPNGGSAEDIEQRLVAIKAKLRDIANGSYQGELADRRFEGHLRKLPPEVIDRLDLWFPEDLLKVEYSTSAEGSGFRAIREGSPGQKTAALLAFLFSYGEEPIILDQPEDDLDNRLIYELIVQQLRTIKRKRQVIVVTHNANIVVNGDAEIVVALATRGGETHQDIVGCLQQKAVRDTICAIMEGGREAFEQRYRRIALEGCHV
ncbi:TrlF family AAA-like ATPase [Candidatus Methylacidiphilum infernorum]|nr:hypothetical protein [Candidatus Methylacidiphilum infernorum]